MFTHLFQHDYFSEDEARIYIGEIILALERLHDVRISMAIMQIIYVYKYMTTGLVLCVQNIVIRSSNLYPLIVARFVCPMNAIIIESSKKQA